MLRRGRSKDRSRKVTPPGPSYMSNEQFAEYLANLRNNRVARPTAARPPPVSTTGSYSTDRQPATTQVPMDGSVPQRSETLTQPKSQSVLSSVNSRHGRALIPQPATATLLKSSIVVPSATYIERGQRWMEKEETLSLRDALEDMDLRKSREEARLHAAAQQEASELVWQHQNPEANMPSRPYRYKEHLRKNSYAHARTASLSRHSGVGVTGLARDETLPRSVSGASNGYGGMLSQHSRVSSGSSTVARHERLTKYENEAQQPLVKSSEPFRDNLAGQKTTKTYGGLSAQGSASSRRRSPGKRNISGEPAGSFTGDQIWEEPEATGSSSKEARDMPVPLRFNPRNPVNKVQFSEDLAPPSTDTPPEPVKKFSRYEIHENPPSQSRNPAYRANPSPESSGSATHPTVPTKDGLEIRSEDIRQATAMKLKDRSPKLPTPTFVSDRPGRPIVSFDAGWKPKGPDLKPVETSRDPRLGRQIDSSRESSSIPDLQLPQTQNPVSLPSIEFPDQPSIRMNTALPEISAIHISPDSPDINLPDVPKINVTDVPFISTSVLLATHPISMSAQPSAASKSSRPLPDPQNSSANSSARGRVPTASPRSHWSAATGSRATATCHQCQLPIEGRVVALRGSSERFHPQCFVCYTCGTGLEALEISPEPEDRRSERLARLQRRAQGDFIGDVPGETEVDDGDERLRFYCHLDWHELFAPRCKHCKTPIIGEHAIALGEHWHYGHFFCAECGDPFEQGMTHIEKDGYAWCLGCQTKRTERQAPKCRKCRKAVIGQYVQAMGGEYHDECFRCATCGGGFEDGQIFPKERDGEDVVLCTKCMERELKA